MQAEVQNKIDYYVELYDRIQERVGNDDIAVVIFQELTKDKRQPSFSKASDNGLATEKQKQCLRKMGQSFPESITRKNASDLIQKGFNK